VLARRTEYIESLAVGVGVDHGPMESDTEEFNDQPDVSEPAVGSTDPALAKYVHLTDWFWHSILNHEQAVSGFEAAVRWNEFGWSLLQDLSHVANSVATRRCQRLERVVKVQAIEHPHGPSVVTGPGGSL
jgi:hypothetical protein